SGGRWLVCVLCLGALPSSVPAEERAWIALTGPQGLDAWRAPTDGWAVVGSVALESQNPRLLETQPGTGILATGPKAKSRNLCSKQSFGDIEAHVEFLIPKGSNSGVKFEGLYEIQILDSYGKKEVTADDLGGIYPRAEEKPKYHHIDKGTPPRTNA